jgi:transcriptional regulator with XRE-family HTH domain
MGTKPRYRPDKLGRKLLHIRNALGLSQSEMIRRLGLEGLTSAARVSEWESGIREPTLPTLLAYGNAARVHLEAIVDDAAILPAKLPGTFDYRRSKKIFNSENQP